MKFRVDGVRVLIVAAFLLLGVAFGSLWWTGQGRSHRQTLHRDVRAKSPGKDTRGAGKDLAAGLNNPLWLDLNRRLADSYRRKQFLESIKTAKEALRTAEKIFGTGDPGMAIATNNLALVYLRQDRFDEASWLFKQTRSIVENSASDSPYRNLNLKNSGLLNQSSEYKMWAWPAVDFRVSGIEPGMGGEEVRKILGEPSPVKETSGPVQPQKSGDGKELVYVYPQFILDFSGTGTELKLGQIRITGKDSATLRGIRIGDSKLAVLWVYGPPVKDEAGLMEYRWPEETAGKPLERYIQLKLDAKETVQEIEIGIRIKKPDPIIQDKGQALINSRYFEMLFPKH